MAIDELARNDRIVLRPMVDADALDLLAVLGDPEVMQLSTSGVMTLDDCRSFIQTARAEIEHTGLGTWAICTPDDPTVVGYCSLRRDPDRIDPGEIEVGYRLARRAWGHGHATAAAMLARDLAFERYDADALVAVIDPSNAASIAVAARLGMRPVRESMLPEYDYPDVVHAVQADEWRQLSR